MESTKSILSPKTASGGVKTGSIAGVFSCISVVTSSLLIALVVILPL